MWDEKIETVLADVPLLSFLVGTDRAWTAWLLKPIMAWVESWKPGFSAVDPCSNNGSTAQPSMTMKLQDYSERFITSTGLLIASSMYVFLFVSALLHIPFTGTWNSSSAVSLLYSQLFARRSLRGQPPYMRFSPKTATFPSTRELRRAIDLWLDDRDTAISRFGHISAWNVTLITNMAFLFEDAIEFDEDLSGWDTSDVKNMSGMFRGTKYFKPSISSWNTSRVLDYSHMFEDSDFSEDISQWNVKAGRDFAFMFHRDRLFNGDLSKWTFGPDVVSMAGLFQCASSFQSDLSNWRIPESTDTSDMFENASAFDLGLRPTVQVSFSSQNALESNEISAER